MEPKREQIKGQIPGKAATSGQDKTGVFKRIKAYSKPIAKAVGTLVAATALAWTLNTGKANAQDYTVVSDSKNKTESIIEGPTIYGTKTFNVKYEKGTLYFDSVKVDEKLFASFRMNVEKADEMGILNKTNEDIEQIYFAKMDGKLSAAYIVFEHGILGVQPVATGIGGGANYTFVGSSNDKVFLNEGAIFITPKGYVVASTPSTLLIIMTGMSISCPYQQIFGKEMLDMKNPRFSQGKNDDYVDVRDETLKYNDKNYKLEIYVNKNFTIEGMEDKTPLGGGN